MRLSLAILIAAAVAAQAAPVSFNRDVRPILSDNCFHCHGPDKTTRDSGLRLDIREEAIKPAESGDIAIVPGNPAESHLLARIASTDRDELMPPPKAHKVLTSVQKETLRRWVAEGAPYEPHWAYAAIQRTAAPAGGNLIDAFVKQPLAERGLQPAPEADRATLIRRLSLDLLGLPPSPAEVAAYVEDATPDAYARLVDRLLASPQYGERMAQGWLDLARYADTVGFHGDQNQNVWAYRDWVVDAFNANKPYDQFTIEQLAGDLLPDPTPQQLTATCFNRLNMMTREGGAQPKEYLAKYAADRIRTVSTTWLGSTFGCAECHDHKFDPISQKDFYALGAFFADVKQWGVYADYSYTPNPDLKGYNNDYPFPPEISVPSGAMDKRIRDVRAELQTAGNSAKGLDEPAFLKWTEETSRFLDEHPSGWQSPAPEVRFGGTVEMLPEGADAEHSVGSSHTVVFKRSTAENVELLIGAVGPVAAIQIIGEIPSGGKRLLRGGLDQATITPEFKLARADGKFVALKMRHADADVAEVRYASGAEVVGIISGWKLPGESAQSVHGTWLLETSTTLNQGDRILVSLPKNPFSAVRIAVSPIAFLDLRQARSSDDLRRSLASREGSAAMLFLLGTGANRELYSKAAALRSSLWALGDGTTRVMVSERVPKPMVTRVLDRGNWQDETGEVVAPATPHFLPPLPGTEGRELTRLDLAHWIMAPDNPLTARVVVNRLWRQFFGTGLSAQVDDLGAQGESPSHPELLDCLAADFRDGWDVKRLVKTLVSSHTYRQISGLRPEVREADPLNRSLAAQNPRRLEAENVRDNALAIAGLLNLEPGGPASKPYQPADYYEPLQFPDRNYVAASGREQYRRGIYTHWQRTFLHPMLANFDAPSREDCIAMRNSANTPQQALTLLNDPTFVEAARVWATRLLAMELDDAARLGQAFAEALARKPRQPEVAALLDALRRTREEMQARPEEEAKRIKVGLAPVAANNNTNEVAAWTTVCRIILNLHETITRY